MNTCSTHPPTLPSLPPSLPPFLPASLPALPPPSPSPGQILVPASKYEHNPAHLLELHFSGTGAYRWAHRVTARVYEGVCGCAC